MKRIIAALLLVCSFALYSQTIVTKTIDPGGTGDYTSLQAWATAMAGNITASGRNEIDIARCICTNAMPDVPASITGFITDSTHYIVIEVDTAYRHKGYYPADTAHVYRIEWGTPMSFAVLLYVATQKVIIDGVAIKNNNIAGNDIQLLNCSDGGLVEHCVLQAYKDTTDPHGHGIRLDATTAYSKYIIRNNFFYGFIDHVYTDPVNCGILTFPTLDSEYVYIDNNTFYQCEYGIWNRGGEPGYMNTRAVVRNNLYQNVTPDGFNNFLVDTSQYVPGTSYGNIALPSSTPTGQITIQNGSFSIDTVAPFVNGGVASIAGWPLHSAPYCLYLSKGYASADVYTNPIGTLQTNTNYQVSFYAAYGGSDNYTVEVEDNLSNIILGSITVSNATTYSYTNYIISFNSGLNTSITIHIVNNTHNSAMWYFDDFTLFTGSGTGSSYFYDVTTENLHLLPTATLALGVGKNLSADLGDPFNDNIDGKLRGSIWNSGAADTVTASIDTTTPPPVDTSSSGCTPNATNDNKTIALIEQPGKESFKYVEGYWVSYKVFSANYFTFFKQDYPMFTHVIDSFGNVFMDGNVTTPSWGLPMEAIVGTTPADTLKIVQGIPFTGTPADTSNHSIEIRSTASGMAGLANKIQTIIGQGGKNFYVRFKIYIPSNYLLQQTSWDTYDHYAYQSIFFIIDNNPMHSDSAWQTTSVSLRQDVTNPTNLVLMADTGVTSYTVPRGATLNIQIHINIGTTPTYQLWVGSTQTAGSPIYTLSRMPTMYLNNSVVIGYGWSEKGAPAAYIDDAAIDSIFIPNNYVSLPYGVMEWGAYTQETSIGISYGGNTPTPGLADSLLKYNVKPTLSIGGWPGQFTGLDAAAGKTEWTSNTPWNYMMKDTTSAWARGINDTLHTGLRGHWLYNLVKLLESKKYQGVDYDFEFPGLDTIGLAGKYQAKLFPDLLQATRYTFDTAGHANWVITMAAPIPWGNTFPDTAYTILKGYKGNDSVGVWSGIGSPIVPADSILWGNWDDRWYDWKRIASIVDVIHIMSYGLSGIWDPKNTWDDALWSNIPGDSNGNYLNMEYTDSAIVARGIPRSKVSIGLGFFGNIWYHNSDIFQSIKNVYTDNSTWASAVTTGNSDIMYPNSYLGDWTSIVDLGAVYGWCNTWAQPYWKYDNPGHPISFPLLGIDHQTGQIVSSDHFIANINDSLSTVLKMKWAYNKGYAGIFIWEITQAFGVTPTGEVRPLLEDAMNANLVNYNSSWKHIKFAKITKPTPQDTIKLVSPVAILTNYEPKFVWRTYLGATGYDLQVSTDSTFTNLVINLLNISDTTYASMLNSLQPSEQYWWRVRARDTSYVSDWGDSTFGTWNSSTPPPTVAIGTITSTVVGNKYSIVIPWNIWSMPDTLLKATSCRIYLNGVYVKNDYGLQLKSGVQNNIDTITVKPGNYAVNVVLYNSSGERKDSSGIFAGQGYYVRPGIAEINILSDRRIQVDSAGNEGNVIVINADSTYNFTLQTTFLAYYSLAIKDRSFLQTASISGNVLTLKAFQGGFTGIKITNTFTGRTRYIGLAVKQSGSVPKFPPYVAVGGVVQYYDSAMSFYQNFTDGNSDLNRRLDNAGWFYYYPSYLADGKIDTYLTEDLRLGIQPSFVWYQINGGVDSYAAIASAFADTAIIKNYFVNLKMFMQHCDSLLQGVPMTVVIEPDMIGYIKLNAASTYLTNSYICNTSKAYSAGVLDSTKDPIFNNYLKGFCEAVNYTIKKYLPNASTGWALPLWAASHNTSPGIIRATDTLYAFNSTGSYSIGRALIDSDFTELSKIVDTLGLNYTTDWLSLEGYGFDGALGSGGIDTSNWTNPSQSAWFWNAQHYDNLLYASSIMKTLTGLPIEMGGDGGHLNHSLSSSPTTYNAGGTFPDLTNSGFQWEDAGNDYFFGDTMVITGANRLAYFSKHPVDDSASVIVKGDTVIWLQHITKAKNSGVTSLMFGAGMETDTHNTPDPGATPTAIPTDNFWWITKLQRYYANPVMK
jgi:GH18 family chitinase